MAAGSYYDQDRTKRLLEIASGDSADDTLLDELGLVANQHLDNILKIHDEKIPYSGTILDDVKELAAIYTAAIYKGKRGDKDTSKFFIDLFDNILEGLALGKAIEGQPYIVERFNSRYITGYEDVFALW